MIIGFKKIGYVHKWYLNIIIWQGNSGTDLNNHLGKDLTLRREIHEIRKINKRNSRLLRVENPNALIKSAVESKNQRIKPNIDRLIRERNQWN